MTCAADMDSDDYYKLLGVDKDVTDAELGKAFKKLALKHHPDKNPERLEQAEEEFKKINEAYEVLSNPDKRKVYDLGGGEAGENPQSGEECSRGVPSPPGGSAQGYTGNASTVPRPQRLPRHVMPLGTSVIIQRMQALDQLNGKRGCIAGWNPEKRIYQVALRPAEDNPDAKPEKKWLKPQYLTQLCTIETTGLPKQEHNGNHGQVFNYDEAKQHYLAIMNGAAVALRPGNCLLPCGTCVHVVGLHSAPECNGQMACITNIDREAARYTVALESGACLKVKYWNVLV